MAIRLLDRHGVAQLFHNTVEICGIGLRRNDGNKAAVVPALADRQIQHTVLLCRHLPEAREVLRTDLNDCGRIWVAGQPRGAGLPDDLIILLGQGKQESSNIFNAAPRQLDRRLRCLQAFLDHQIGSLCTNIHKKCSFQNVLSFLLLVFSFSWCLFRPLFPILLCLRLQSRNVRFDAPAEVQAAPRLPQTLIHGR